MKPMGKKKKKGMKHSKGMHMMHSKSKSKSEKMDMLKKIQG